MAFFKSIFGCFPACRSENNFDNDPNSANVNVNGNTENNILNSPLSRMYKDKDLKCTLTTEEEQIKNEIEIDKMDIIDPSPQNNQENSDSYTNIGQNYGRSVITKKDKVTLVDDKYIRDEEKSQIVYSKEGIIEFLNNLEKIEMKLLFESEKLVLHWAKVKF